MEKISPAESPQAQTIERIKVVKSRESYVEYVIPKLPDLQKKIEVMTNENYSDLTSDINEPYRYVEAHQLIMGSSMPEQSLKMPDGYVRAVCYQIDLFLDKIAEEGEI